MQLLASLKFGKTYERHVKLFTAKSDHICRFCNDVNLCQEPLLTYATDVKLGKIEVCHLRIIDDPAVYHLNAGM